MTARRCKQRTALLVYSLQANKDPSAASPPLFQRSAAARRGGDRLKPIHQPGGGVTLYRGHTRSEVQQLSRGTTRRRSLTLRGERTASTGRADVTEPRRGALAAAPRYGSGPTRSEKHARRAPIPYLQAQPRGVRSSGATNRELAKRYRISGGVNR